MDHQADTLASVWRHLSPARIDEVVPALPEKLLKQALHVLDPGVLAISLPRISEESRNRCLALLPRRSEAEVRRLMDYPAGSAGRVMDSRIPSFRGEQPAAMTLEQLRQSKPKDLRQLFIVDAERRLTGIVDIHDLLDRRADGHAERDQPPAERGRVAVRRSRRGRGEIARLAARRAARRRHSRPLDRRHSPRSVAEDPRGSRVGRHPDDGGRRPRGARALRAAVRRPQAVAVAANQSRDGVSRGGRRRVVRVDDRAIHGAGRADAGRRGAVG